MEQYIPKAAVLAEIENLLDKGRYHEEYDCAYRDGNNGALYALKGKLNTLEVKGLDLEREIKEVQRNYKTIEEYEGYPCTMYADGIEWIAKHFYELGLKAQKGE